MSILRKPLITEKSQVATDKLNKFGFIVDKTASKDEIKAEVEKMFTVEVISVNTMRYAGKLKAKFTKAGNFTGRKPSFKKAFVTLKEGQNINFFENV